MLGSLVAFPGHGYASAAAAYSAWAAELGVADTGTLSAFDGDDSMFILDLGFAPLAGGTETRVAISTESGLSLYQGTLVNPGSEGYGSFSSGAASVSRMYAPPTRPPLMITVREVSLDSGTYGSKWRKTATEAILFYNTSHYSNQQANALSVAIRLSAGKLKIVVSRITSDIGRLQIFQWNGSTLVSGQVLHDPITGTICYVTASPTTLAGTTADSSGTPAPMHVRAYDRAGGNLLWSGTSGSDGAYSTEIFATGELQVVCLAEDGADPLVNDQIARVLP